MVKRAKITTETYDSKPKALDKLLGTTPKTTTTEQEAGEQTTTTETPTLNRTYQPTSVYLDDDQLSKIDDLVYEYRKRTGKRTSRNAIIRAFVNHTSIEDIINLLRS